MSPADDREGRGCVTHTATEGREFDAWFVAAAAFLALVVGSDWTQVALWFSTDDHAFWVFVVLTGGIAAVIVTALEVIAAVLLRVVLRRRRSLSTGLRRLAAGVMGAVPALLFAWGLVVLHANPLLHLVNVVVWALVALVLFAALKQLGDGPPQSRPELTGPSA